MEKIAKTLSIHIISELSNITDDAADFNYQVNIDDRSGYIKITPVAPSVIFTDAYLISGFDTLDKMVGNKRIVAINLAANLELVNTDDDDFMIDINDIGELEIQPFAAKDGELGSARFISCAIENETQLVTEAADTEFVDSEDEPAWRVVYKLPLEEDLDTESEELQDSSEIIHAPDAQTAVKYAEQQARINAKDNAAWEDAEIISIEKQS